MYFTFVKSHSCFPAIPKMCAHYCFLSIIIKTLQFALKENSRIYTDMYMFWFKYIFSLKFDYYFPLFEIIIRINVCTKEQPKIELVWTKGKKMGLQHFKKRKKEKNLKNSQIWTSEYPLRSFKKAYIHVSKWT